MSISTGSLIVLPNSRSIEYSERTKYQSIDSTNYYGYVSRLLEMLRELGAITFDADNRLILSSFFTNNKPSAVSRLLGYAAEAIIVRECNQSLEKNRKWANYARRNRQERCPFKSVVKSIFYTPFLANPDDFIAVGTGFASTQNGNYSKFYNPISDRDICWVSKGSTGRQLLTVEGVKQSRQRYSGLQVKVSCADNAQYVTNYFKKKKFYTLYPVVYFDLGNDFYKVRDNLINLDSSMVKPDTIFSNDVDYGNYSRADIVDMMLIRGKYVDESMQEELLFYKHIFKKIISGKIDIHDLTNENVLISLITDYVGHNLIRETPILNVSVAA